MKKLGKNTIFGLCFFLASCGGGGGGSGGSGSNPAEIIYALSETPTSNTSSSSSLTGNCTTSNGCITEYAINPSNGSLYSGEAQISTQGTYPFELVFDPVRSYAYVLNNQNSNQPGTSTGTIYSFSVTNTGLSENSTSHTDTGENPYTIAVDSAGGYLVVSDQGSGSTTGGGGVEVFQLSNGGFSSNQAAANYPCQFPDTVVFPPSTNGTSSETVYITCSSPEKLGSSPPTPKVWQCTIAELASSSCTQVTFTGLSLSGNDVLYNLVFNSAGTKAYAPGYDSTLGGIVLAFTISSGTMSYTGYAQLPTTTSFYPSGKIGVITLSGTDYVLVGDYPSSSGSSSTPIGVCSTFTSGTCSSVTPSAYTYPFSFTVGSSSTYVAMAGGNITAGSSSAGGVLVYGNSTITGSGSPTASQQVGTGSGSEPTEVTLDSSASFAVVPFYGTTSMDLFQVLSDGTLSYLQSLSVNGVPSLVYIK